MADDIRNGMPPHGEVDDDRLLACALGLDDDPALEAAAAADPELGRRLESARAEVGRVADGVRAAVPPPGDDYTDLSDARWAGLQEYFTPARERPARAGRGSRRWLRVLAPVAAVALVVAVGVSVIERQTDLGEMSVADRGGKSGDSAVTAAGQTAGESGGEAAESAGDPLGGGTPLAAGPQQGPDAFDAASHAPVVMAGGMAVPSGTLNRLSALQEQMSDFAVIVLATAQQAADGFQDFLVLRVLRGDSPALLRLRIAGRLADAGRLHLVMLQPFSGAGLAPMPATSAAPDPGLAEETSTTAIVAVAEAEMFTSSAPVLYTYEGDMAVAQALPEGTDPYAVTLP